MFMHYFQCLCCGKRFIPNKRLKGNIQQYCNSEICQRKRKSEWEKQKYKNNESYRKEKLANNLKYKSKSFGSKYQKKYRGKPSGICRKMQKKAAGKLQKTCHEVCIQK